MSNVIIINQARMMSQRLPGKIMLKVMGKSLLEFQIERLSRVEHAKNLIIATTNNGSENPIIDLCNKLSVDFFKGSEDDVLTRYYEAASFYKADIIVRVTSDCPLIDPKVIDEIIRYYLSSNYDYVSNTLIRTYPRGMDTEVFSFKALAKANSNATEPCQREHVTQYIVNNPQIFKLANYSYKDDLSKYRWTVDAKKDFVLIKLLLEEAYTISPYFSLDDCVRIITKHPEWNNINSSVVQKE